MLLTTLYRITKTSIVSFCRNWWLSLAATLIMILTLVTISFFVSLLVVTNKTTQSLREKADLTAYFHDTATTDQIFAIQDVLFARSDVKKVDYVSKEAALDRWRNRKGNEEIRDVVSETDNPLPRSLEIKAQKPEDLEKINDYLSADEYKSIIKQISYQKNKDLIDRLVRITTFIKIVGYSLSALFVLISLLIIYNTVRLTIYARSEEIEIMKLVGGSDWHIRGPFVIEGVGYGFLGAIISSFVFYFFLKFSVPSAEKYLGIVNMNSSYLGLNLIVMTLLQFIVGMILGGFCSVLAIKKHLK